MASRRGEKRGNDYWRSLKRYWKYRFWFTPEELGISRERSKVISMHRELYTMHSREAYTQYMAQLQIFKRKCVCEQRIKLPFKKKTFNHTSLSSKRKVKAISLSIFLLVKIVSVCTLWQIKFKNQLQTKVSKVFFGQAFLSARRMSLG